MNVLDLTSNLIAVTIQTSIIVVGALVVVAILRVTAAHVRHFLFRVVLAVCLLLPLLQPRIALVTGGELPSRWLDFTRSGAVLPWRSSPAADRSRTDGALEVSALGGRWALGVLFVLGAGACIRILLIGAGLLRLRRLRESGLAAPPDAYDDLQARVGARPHIRFVAHLGQPITFGARRAVVLLPDALRSLSPGIQHAVVAHELWHVRRRDWLWVVGEEIVRSLFWFNPAILVLISRIQASREETVDELAILSTGSRRNYLDALVAFADRPSLFAAAAFARRRHLVHRVLAISKESVMSSTRVVACSAILAAVVAGAGWYSVSAFPLTVSAQSPRDRVPPPPPPPPPPPAGRFEEMEVRMLSQVQAQPNAANYHTLATLYFERAFRQQGLTPDQKSDYVTKGLAAADQALAYDADYAEAMIYKNLLLRLQAQLTTDPADRARAIKEADLLRARALELRKQQPPQTAAGRPGSMAPPPPPPPPNELTEQPPKIDGEFPLRVGGNIEPPKKIRDVRPVYPPEALAGGLEGAVIVELMIDREGKVRNGRVLKSVPGLDHAALEAVRQWEFEPVLLNGAPKPVMMVVTLNFSLK
jgi:TonB family protein